MKLKSWYTKRGPKFICQRGIRLLDRYSIGSRKATCRINKCIESLAEAGCSPTLFTPGIIVKQYPKFIRHLQHLGAEIAVHGYHHLHLSHLPLTVAEQHLWRAIRTFEHFGIENHGFRCPYLSYSDDLLDSLPGGMFEYSSNEAIYWDVIDPNILNRQGLYFNRLEKFYNPLDSSENVCLPTTRSNMVEIPICVPDDLQLHDGLCLDEEGITQVWTRFLKQTHIRGELFTLLCHTELASLNVNSLLELVSHARQYQPLVWITRLRDISDWWREKSKFGLEITSNLGKLTLTFDCSPRATILVRGLDALQSGLEWDGKYFRLLSNTLDVPANPRPFIGLTDGIPERVVSFLHDQGYIVDSSETAKLCGIILDSNILTKLPNDVKLVNYIETSQAPLVRYWRWPDAAMSAFCVTGDLDALSLLDYACRLFAR